MAGDIMIRVVPPPDRVGELAGATLTERFHERVDELAQSIGEVALELRERLDRELTQSDGGGWMLSDVSLTFSLDVEAEAGVVIAKAKTSAGFEVSLAWSRADA